MPVKSMNDWPHSASSGAIRVEPAPDSVVAAATAGVARLAVAVTTATIRTNRCSRTPNILFTPARGENHFSAAETTCYSVVTVGRSRLLAADDPDEVLPRGDHLVGLDHDLPARRLAFLFAGDQIHLVQPQHLDELHALERV